MEKCKERSATPLCVRRAENATKLYLRMRRASGSPEGYSRLKAITMPMKDQTQNNIYENMNRIPWLRSVITGPSRGRSE